MSKNPNSWSLCSAIAGQLKQQSLSDLEIQQKREQLTLLHRQIASLKGAHGVEAYNKLGELLAEARAINSEIN